MQFNLWALLFLITAALAQTASPNTFWNDYPVCENQCHQSVWASQSCSLQNSCGGCSGCLCLNDNCLCETPSWLEAVAQCIGQKCGSAAAIGAASIVASGCGSYQLTLAINQQSLASIGVAAAAATATTTSATAASTATTTGTTAVTSTGTTVGGTSSRTGGDGRTNSNGSGSGFSSPGAVAGYAIAGLVVASLAVCIGWRQLRIAQKNRREKKLARRSQLRGV